MRGYMIPKTNLEEDDFSTKENYGKESQSFAVSIKPIHKRKWLGL